MSQPDREAGGESRPARPASPSEYLMALEPPDPTPPPVPAQPRGGHDAPRAERSPADRATTGAASTGASSTGAATMRSRPARAGRGRTVALVLTSLLALLALAAAATLGALWLDLDRELAEAREQHFVELDALTTQQAEQQREIGELTADLRRAADDLDTIQRQLADTQDRVAELRDGDGPVRACLAASEGAIAAASVGDLLAFDAFSQEAREHCGEAADLLAADDD